MTRLTFLVGIAVPVIAAAAGQHRVTKRAAPTAAACGLGASIPSTLKASIVLAAVETVVLDPSGDFGGRKRWCAQPKPLFVIFREHIRIGDCRRMLFVTSEREALRQTNLGADYVKVDVHNGGDDRFIEIVAERGIIVKGRDAVQSEAMRTHSPEGDEPTLFRQEVVRYRVTTSRDRIDVCRYSSLVL